MNEKNYKKLKLVFILSIVLNYIIFSLLMSWRLWNNIADLLFTMLLLVGWFNLFTIYFMSHIIKELDIRLDKEELKKDG